MTTHDLTISSVSEQQLRESTLTIGDLLGLVDALVEQKLKEKSRPQLTHSTLEDREKLWQIMRANIIKASPGIPSPTEMLREERDKWYSL